MTQPIVFISHSRVREGKLDEVRSMLPQGMAGIEASKPGTHAQLAYLDDGASEVTIVHVFPDSAALDAHLEGVAERVQRAAESIETLGYEIYGPASEAVLDVLRSNREATLRADPHYVAGFLRSATPSR